MNEIQKEPVRANLGDEKRLMNHLRAIYEKASKDIASKLQFHDSKIAVMLMQVDDLDEEQLSELQAQIYQRDFQKQLKKQIDDIMKNINDEQYNNIDEFMKKSYENGFIGTLYDIQSQGVPLILPINQQEILDAIQMNSKISKRLYNHLGENVDFLKKRIANNIARGIATSLSYKEIATNIERDSIIGFNRAMRIARTEGHNMRMQGIERAQHKAKEKGADIVKQWDATLDARTRDSHAKLDGEIRELDEKFSNGMMRPGDKNAPAGEVVNCRCTMLQRARWALGVDELNTLKKRAEFFGLDKAKDFEEYRRKYLKIVENSAESGIIKKNSGRSYIKLGCFVNPKEPLAKYSKEIEPIDGYVDFVCHADLESFIINDIYGSGEDDYYEVRLSAKEFADLIKRSSDFKGGPIRLISCKAGARPDGLAQQLATELGVEVLASTEIVNVDNDGRILLTDNWVLADMWFRANDEEKSSFINTGRWEVFKP